MSFKKAISLILILLLVMPPFTSHAEANGSTDQPADETADQTAEIQNTETVIEDRYHTVLEKWEKEGVTNVSNFETFVAPSNFLNSDDLNLLSSEESMGYGDNVIHWNDQNPSLSLEVTVPSDGLYELSFDYYPIGNEVIPIEGSVLVNREYQYYESRRIVFPSVWKNAQDEFEKDRFGNEIIPKQVSLTDWRQISAEDASHLQSQPLKFFLKEGSNEITLSHLRGEMLVGKVYVHSPTRIPSYKEYTDQLPDGEEGKELIIHEGEIDYTKNSSFIRPIATVDSSVVPNDPKYLLLNSVGGESWEESGQQINWNVSIKEAGYYRLTFKVIQNKTTGGTVFRNVLIDGEIPFSEVAHYPFEFNKKWTNSTIDDEKGDPYLFYFSEGEHEISLQADASPVNRTINTINQVITEMQDLSLSIKKLTGNQDDKSREWNITEFFPDIEAQLDNWANRLDEESKYLKELYNGDDSQDIVSLNLAVQKLRTLNEKPNEIPNRLTELTEGSSSVTQLLGNLLLELPKQPLLVDRFYVHGDQDIPKDRASFWKTAAFNIKRFVQSFTAGNYSADGADENTLEIWVNRPRQYVELIQNLADQSFTPETGIKVQFSIMPDESKLILASAANNQPDVAIGVSNWLPYELAIRDAVYDLHQFGDFESYSKQFSPGAFLPLMIDDSVYAIPETQDFFVQFYRKDILEKLNIPVPNTWDDVVQILPELQRYGMNYYTPIAGATGSKPFATTVPYVYQFGGELYSENGMLTAIDEEESLQAIQFMADLNTIYSMPMQVPNFYNHFRYSTLPVGIANFTTYVQLTSAAPEIAGWWDISPYPGVEQEDGTVSRWATGSGQSGMIFNGTKSADDSWEFLKWWMSTDTQTEFANTLQLLYGPEYMWNTANLEAFKNLPWPEEHKETILAQWEYLKEVPKTPGSYILEREISNIWNKIVFEGENTRAAIDDSVIAINREMIRKMEEFGYMKNGQVVKPYHIPTIEQVMEWGGNENEE
ncbi:extracellular solute-binding protein [Caldibacillus lycopersici]|uniref:Extracellular solute-binding protein n=1 Tax=Perspicuibacillus lycopersici TaxID=1325689 RepID=A0AAE3ISM1_9BACI|nr:extracellular solute-binding protein [Perspicuibacillus lycopersici]MCU9612681.1 extracellular solute-binding protein [Perspicuibacillus lycopersici]